MTGTFSCLGGGGAGSRCASGDHQAMEQGQKISDFGPLRARCSGRISCHCRSFRWFAAGGLSAADDVSVSPTVPETQMLELRASKTKIGPPYPRIVGQGGALSFHDDFAGLDHIAPVGDVQGPLQILFDQKN